MLRIIVFLVLAGTAFAQSVTRNPNYWRSCTSTVKTDCNPRTDSSGDLTITGKYHGDGSSLTGLAGGGNMVDTTYVTHGPGNPANPCSTAGSTYQKDATLLWFFCPSAGGNWIGPMAIVAGSAGQLIFHNGTTYTASDKFTVNDTTGVMGAKGGYTAGQAGTYSGVHCYNGYTSGRVCVSVAAVAGTEITYLWPSTNGAAGKVLSDTGAAACPTLPAGLPATCHQLDWEDQASGTSLPDQTGNDGKFLTTNGTTASWGTPAGGLTAGTLTPFALTYTDADGVLQSTDCIYDPSSTPHTITCGDGSVPTTITLTDGGEPAGTVAAGKVAIYSESGVVMVKVGDTTAPISAGAGLADPGGNGVVYRSALNTTRVATGADLPGMVGSGASHSGGAVPDPGASAGTTKYLREDGQWTVPPGSAAGGSWYSPDKYTAQTEVTITGATHGLTHPVPVIWSDVDGSGNQQILQPDGGTGGEKPVDVNSTTHDVTIRFSSATTFWVQLVDGGGSAAPTKSWFEQFYPPAGSGTGSSLAAGGWSVASTNGPSLMIRGTAPFNTYYLQFSGTTNQTINFRTRLRTDWDSTSATTLTLAWEANLVNDGETVIWLVNARCLAPGTEAFDLVPTWSDTYTITTTVTNAGNSLKWAENSQTLTMTSCAAGNILDLQFTRDAVTDAADAAIYFIGPTLKYAVTNVIAP